MNQQRIIICIIATLLVGTVVAQVSVSVDKMNVLYVGVDNPITIAAAGVPCKDLKISITNGTLSGSNCNYVVRCHTVGRCDITVTSIRPTRKTWVSQFQVKGIPKPIFKIGPYSQYSCSASKSIIQAQQYVRAEAENSELNIQHVIDSCRIRIIRDTTELFNWINKGNQLDQRVRDALAVLMKGDVVVIDHIWMHSAALSASLKGYYASTTYDEYGNVVYDPNQTNTDPYLVLQLEPLHLRID